MYVEARSDKDRLWLVTVEILKGVGVVRFRGKDAFDLGKTSWLDLESLFNSRFRRFWWHHILPLRLKNLLLFIQRTQHILLSITLSFSLFSTYIFMILDMPLNSLKHERISSLLHSPAWWLLVRIFKFKNFWHILHLNEKWFEAIRDGQEMWVLPCKGQIPTSNVLCEEDRVFDGGRKTPPPPWRDLLQRAC